MLVQLLLGSVIAVARIEAVPEVVVGAANGEICCRGPRIADRGRGALAA